MVGHYLHLTSDMAVAQQCHTHCGVDGGLELHGAPLVATNAVLLVSCTTLDGADPKTLIDQAWSVCTVASSLNRGVPTTLKVV